MVRRITAVVASFGLAYVLIRTPPHPLALARGLRAPHRWVQSVGVNGATIQLVGAVLWAATTWLLLALVASVWVERTGHRRGFLAALARSAPPQLRRAVLTSVGVSLLFGTVDAHAASAQGSVSISATSTIAPGWPLNPGAPSTQPSRAAPTSSPPPSAAVAPAWPMSTQPPTSAVPSDVPPVDAPPDSPPGETTPATPALTKPTPTYPAPTGPIPTHPAQIKPTGTKPTGAKPTGAKPAQTTPAQSVPSPGLGTGTPPTVTVQPGDSLWAIAAQRLGPDATDSEVAVVWPYWYRQNRRVIGSDPELLQPGQRLVIPSHQKGR